MRRLVPLFAVIVLMLSGCGGPAAGTASGGQGIPATIRIGLVPNIAPEQQRAKYRPLAEYLEKRLGSTVELFVASDYAGVVAALVGGRIDVAYLGGLTYAQAEPQVPISPLVTEIDQATGTTRYHSAIVVARDSAYRDLRKDVVEAGRSFAFGDVSSTSGSLYPRLMLTQAGARCDIRRLDSCPPLGRITFTGGHDATAQAVLAGTSDAGGIELRILRRLERDGKLPAGALRVIAEREVQGYPWVVRDALGKDAHQRLVEAFTAIADPRLLDLMRAQRFAAVTAADYEEVRREARRLGLAGS